MPIWLQMTAAVSAALASGVMGVALVPFLGKCRFCEPEQSESKEDAAAGNKLRPTMCGLLLCFGILFGLVIGFTLYQQFSGADRTGKDYQLQSSLLRTALLHGVLLTAAGFVSDLLRIRYKLRSRFSPLLQITAVFLVTLGLLTMQQGFVWTVFPAAAAAAVCWRMTGTAEHETDGVCITLGAIQCLVLTVVLLAKGTALPALYTLTAAGACMGCMVWNLHPAKCQLGDTGRFLLGSIVPILCAAQGDWEVLALNVAVYAVNLLPLLRRKERTTLLVMMEQAGLAPWKRITLLAVFAVFCGVVTLIVAA